jgi:hypothetical protein
VFSLDSEYSIGIITPCVYHKGLVHESRSLTTQTGFLEIQETPEFLLTHVRECSRITLPLRKGLVLPEKMADL